MLPNREHAGMLAPTLGWLMNVWPRDFTRCRVDRGGHHLLQGRSAMKVKDAMHKGVEWVSPETPVTEIAKLMQSRDVGAIPIGENDRLIGMVTDRDIVCKGLANDAFDARKTTAREVMTAGIHCCR